MTTCSVCQRGREACEYLTDCESQAAYKYVIACDYDSAVLPR